MTSPLRPGRWRGVASLLLLSLLGVHAALAVQLPIAMFGRDVGLDKRNIRALYQDHDGFIWIGTSVGLYVFDGASFLQMDSVQGFQPSDVVGMAEGSSGDFWGATLAGMQLRHHGRFGALNPMGRPLLADRGQVSTTEEWTFVLAAPWWRSPWVALLALPVVLAGIVLIWRWRSRVLIARTRHTEQTVERRTAQISAALRARNDLLAMISHDLRSPLSNIIECVNRWNSGDGKRDYPRIIEQSVWQQIALIDDLLEFAQDEHASAELEKVAGYLHAFLADVASQAWLMAERGANRFVHRFDERLPMLVKADFRRLRQVLVNLLGNATKFTHDGLVEFEVCAEECHDARVRLRFTIKDSGIGLAYEEIDSLTKPFVRGANVEHREGSGLGLSIVAQWLDRMHSRLQLKQVATGGCEFSFVLDLDLASESEVISNLLNDDPMDQSLDGRGRVIVVVDDQPQNRDMICDLLDSYGFASFPAGEGKEALKLVEEENAAMVITDQYMDGMDGWMLLDALRRANPRLPVVLCSASPPRPPAFCAVGLDFDAVLMKPTSVRQLLQVVTSRLDAVSS
ncbi:ATP-binding protein [Dyella sp. 20L07]|uniref:hybrid sensor histidine kinase/response regulator n=1 Tax=Dyella sp. 20L07 TaxID=3384240 RepID=UPI003D2E3024